MLFNIFDWIFDDRVIKCLLSSEIAEKICGMTLSVRNHIRKIVLVILRLSLTTKAFFNTIYTSATSMEVVLAWVVM